MGKRGSPPLTPVCHLVLVLVDCVARASRLVSSSTPLLPSPFPTSPFFCTTGRVKVAAGEKVAEAVAELRDLETDVKECERRIRFGRDFDSIMDYFASMGALRRREAELRDSLIMDLALVEKTMQEVCTRARPRWPLPGHGVVCS